MAGLVLRGHFHSPRTRAGSFPRSRSASRWSASSLAPSQQLDAILEGWGVSTRVAEPLAYVLVIGAITYLSVIIGELVPKNFALKNPEGIACAVAPLMRLISRLAAPVVWVLDASTKLIFRLLSVSTESASAVTDEEIKTIVAEAETAGVIETDERKMISGVMRLADRAVMTRAA